MIDEDRPDPEYFLSLLKKEEIQEKKGKLKIFFGMSAGVGKTYAMLKEAQEKLQEGVDVAIGTVVTHGRRETAQLLEGIRVIPEKWINYKDTVFEEPDIDEILKQKPQLVLIDELAHSNVTGSRHPKRWQDVMEILDAGIDVYTTLNVQHLESRKDMVEDITNIPIRETVPDLILERANHIELVDITPQELLKRLKEGKVYLGPQSEMAAKNFFQEDRLTALREMALRLTAEKVDHDLHGLLTLRGRPKSWRPTERLMVAISYSPYSQQLIRMARRLAFNLDAPWIAVYVNTGVVLSEKENIFLAKNMALARELGAEVITTTDTNIAEALKRIATQKSVSQIIIGRPAKRTFMDFFTGLFEKNLLDQLSRDNIDADIHVMGQSPLPETTKSRTFRIQFLSHWMSYLAVLGFIAVLTVLNLLIEPLIGYKLIGFIFLLGILFLSLFVGSGPIFLSAILSAMIWYYYFMPFPQSFRIAQKEDVILLLVYLMTAIINGVLMNRVKDRELILRRREERAEALYDILRQITRASSSEDVLSAVSQRIGTLLIGNCEIIIENLKGELAFDSASSILQDEKERAVAIWVFQNGKEAGWSTDTLPSVKRFYIPLKGFKEIVGVLAFQPSVPRSLSHEETNFLYTVGQELAQYLERSFAEERVRWNRYLQQIEKVHQTILNTISKEFRGPLTLLQNVVQDLKKDKGVADSRAGLRVIQQIENTSGKLSHIVDNVLIMEQLSLEAVTIHKKYHNVQHLIQVCVGKLSKHLVHYDLKISVADPFPLIDFDFSLLEILLHNLLLNAIENSPEGTRIEIEAKTTDSHFILSILDEGRGIPPEVRERIFEKFYRIPGTKTEGMGLGLSIAKMIADLHQGYLEVRNRDRIGSIFSLIIPYSKAI